MVHEKRIEIRWRDMDAFRHVNNAVYATYLEECRDEWAERALGDAGDLWDFVLARVAIDYRRELTQDDDAIVVTLPARPDRQLEPDAARGDPHRDRRALGRGGGRARRPRPGDAAGRDR